MTKKHFISSKLTTLVILLISVILFFGCNEKKSALDPKNPTTVTIWYYYSGTQATAFENMIEAFNSTVGIEKGVIIDTIGSPGSINKLADNLLDSVAGKAGADKIPTLAGVYAETAYILDKQDALISFDNYFTQKELDAYIPGFLNEGRFNANNDLLLFPLLKSTELFTANETDWKPFADATGITIESLKTKEDLTAAAAKYYEWTDSLTPDVKEDGKALYGRDSIANYIYAGCYQLGQAIFDVKNGVVNMNFNRKAWKTLWDNYYIPFINGYFGAYGKYRSDDAKIGKILALTGSSSSVSFLPAEVTLEGDVKHSISMSVSKDLLFKDAMIDTVVQQGASYCLLKTSEAQQEGAVEFLKWFTENDHIMNFAVDSSYLPSTILGNQPEAIKAAYKKDLNTYKGKFLLDSLVVSAESFAKANAYSTLPFNGSKEIRAYVETEFENVCKNDRSAVVEAIKTGKTRAEAVAPYITDEYFDAWFTEVCNQIKILSATK